MREPMHLSKVCWVDDKVSLLQVSHCKIGVGMTVIDKVTGVDKQSVTANKQSMCITFHAAEAGK